MRGKVVSDTLELKWLKNEVHAILKKNRQVGSAAWCGKQYDFTCPSHITYPFQWFWDSCFHAIASSHVDPALGEREIISLLENQHDDGFVSHVTFWQRDVYEEMVSTYAIAFRTRYLSDEMQPPLLAEAVEAVASRGRGAAFIKEVLPKVTKFYDWCDRVRNPYGDGLIRVVQPDETGLDHSPKWDALMQLKEYTVAEANRGWHRVCDPYDEFNRDPKKMIELDHFVVADVMVNTIYIENLRVLADLCDQVGSLDEAHKFRDRAQRAFNSLIELCWDDADGLFYDVANKANTKLRVNTFTSLMPLLLPDLPRTMSERLIAHMFNPKEYWAEYPVPTVSISEPTFEPGTVGDILVWRGPTWMNSNWYLARGLKRHGYPEQARRIADQSVKLVKSSGFREYYNPFTTAGAGAPDFSWSTILLDLYVLTRED